MKTTDQRMRLYRWRKKLALEMFHEFTELQLQDNVDLTKATAFTINELRKALQPRRPK